MPHKIEVASTVSDGRATTRKREIEQLGIYPGDVRIVDTYSIDTGLSPAQLTSIANGLKSVAETATIDTPNAPDEFDIAIEVSRKPGVTDPDGDTVAEGIDESLCVETGVYTSQTTFLTGVSEQEAQQIAPTLHNPLIENVQIKTREQFQKDKGMGISIPKVQLQPTPPADIVPVRDVSDLELKKIGRWGIFDHYEKISRKQWGQWKYDNIKDHLKVGEVVDMGQNFYKKVRRGPLALDLTYMNAIKDYFQEQGRNPTDVELESIAQTWSEHCKHTIFADPIDEIKDGLYKHFIQRATKEIREKKGEDDFCVSVFKDNAGVIKLNDNFHLCDKMETHNSPSGLDGYGGAGTGIGGVIRDIMGVGLGAWTFMLAYAYAFADPRSLQQLYKGSNKTQPLESRLKNMRDIIRGVEDYGNQSGIPTPQGMVIYDQRFAGKPLVFVRALGLLPVEVDGQPGHEKKANPGDKIIVVGGRTGKDGIHGATFSSEALTEGSPATAVQIGDPITQKKTNDFEMIARDRGLYNSITDNGAGGLSCSVGEMAKEAGGSDVNLEKVPLKYAGLRIDETWISEAQERITFAVPENKEAEFKELAAAYGVEATTIGIFTDSGKCIVRYNKEVVMDVDMEFLHNGLPKRPMTTTFTRPVHEEPDFEQPGNLTASLQKILARPNIASFMHITQRYDHEVQGGSVLKPLQGKGLVNGDATAVRPDLTSEKTVIVSQGFNPFYSDIDTYNMAACAIDTAVRNAIAAGANPDYLALMDNFCWCSSDEPERLGQLKRAAQACYDYATAYETPFISGKDSMFNDFKGFDEKGNPIKISIPPTLLVSSVSVVDSPERTISIDAKMSGDLVYVLGETQDELGASEYFAMQGEEINDQPYIGNAVPEVDAEKNNKLYRSFAKCVQQDLVSSATSVHRGGLAVALAKTAMGGRIGLDVTLKNLPGTASRDDYALFSESQGRIVVTIAADQKETFEKQMKGNACSLIGIVNGEDFKIRGMQDNEIVNAKVNDMLASYRSTFEGY